MGKPEMHLSPVGLWLSTYIVCNVLQYIWAAKGRLEPRILTRCYSLTQYGTTMKVDAKYHGCPYPSAQPRADQPVTCKGIILLHRHLGS